MAWPSVVGGLLLATAALWAVRQAVLVRRAYPNRLQAVLYGWFRRLYRWEAARKTAHWPALAGEGFELRYEPGTDPSLARLVLATAQEQYGLVRDFLKVREDLPILLLVHRDRESLREGFGWGPEDGAMGVYWAGVIRILSPSAWLRVEDPQQRALAFRREGPVAHELAHLLIDRRTGGNCPRWLSEGLAQQAERIVTGAEVRLDEIAAPGSGWYALPALDEDFDRLPDQELAYRQSLGLVEYLTRNFGAETIRGLLAALGRGESFSQALRAGLGLEPGELETGFKRWAG